MILNIEFQQQKNMWNFKLYHQDCNDILM